MVASREALYPNPTAVRWMTCDMGVDARERRSSSAGEGEGVGEGLRGGLSVAMRCRRLGTLRPRLSDPTRLAFFLASFLYGENTKQEGSTTSTA